MVIYQEAKGHVLCPAGAHRKMCTEVVGCGGRYTMSVLPSRKESDESPICEKSRG